MNLKKITVLSFSGVIALASLVTLGLGGEANATGTTLNNFSSSHTPIKK